MEKSSENKIDINQFTNLLLGKPSTYVPEKYRSNSNGNSGNWNFMDEIMKYANNGVNK